jgi:hypothetical protein
LKLHFHCLLFRFSPEKAHSQADRRDRAALASRKSKEAGWNEEANSAIFTSSSVRHSRAPPAAGQLANDVLKPFSRLIAETSIPDN